ncbi:E3 Ubiquitin-Protein Ligase Hecw2 [Manis pentadactyla]|nr:E3 Ubiquitin-Protein Ligase Hecw2 [Manis pentadactyla]
MAFEVKLKEKGICVCGGGCGVRSGNSLSKGTGAEEGSVPPKDVEDGGQLWGDRGWIRGWSPVLSLLVAAAAAKIKDAAAVAAAEPCSGCRSRAPAPPAPEQRTMGAAFHRVNLSANLRSR